MTDSPLRLVAIDLGAESGRVVVGTFDGGRLALQDVHRFANVPVTLAGTLHWDFLRLFGDVTAGLRRAAAGGPVASVGVDTWGVDFGLLDDRGRLLGNPVHYRDARTAGMPDLAFASVPREEIYRATGIQFMPINTLFQLLSMARAGDPQLRQADRLLMMGDLFAHFLCGSSVAEYTNASTSQCLDPFARDWARPLLERLGIPTGFLPEIVQPGTVLGPSAPTLPRTRASRDARSSPRDPTTPRPRSWAPAGRPNDGVPLVGDLVADRAGGGGPRGVRRDPGRQPHERGRRGRHDPPAAQRHGALAGPGEPARAVAGGRRAPSYEELAALAEAAPAFTAFIDPDDERFLRPGDLPARVRAFCAETGQPVPQDAGTLIRVILESLALRYAVAVDELARASGHPVEAIHVVGGGSNHRLLCRLTAGATGLPVRAGPVEATAIGNLAVQAIAAGELASVAEARELVARSFPVTAYDPEGDWAEARARFAALVARPAPEPASASTAP